MDELLHLAGFVDRNKLDDSVLKNKSGRDSSYKKLYRGIISGKVKSDKQAENYLFNSKNYNGLWRAKSQLREKLLELVMSVNLNNTNFSSLKKHHLLAWKHFTVAEFLSKNGFRQVSIPLLVETIKIAHKIDNTELVILISSKLYRHYAFIELSNSKYKKYEKILFESLEIFKYEMEANKYYVELSHLDAQGLSNNKLFLEKLNDCCDALNKVKKEIKSFKFYYVKFSIHSTKYFYEKNYHKLLKNANNAIYFFSKKPYSTYLVEISFMTDKIYGNIMLKQHHNAEALINSLIPNIAKYTFAYYKAQYFHFFNYITWEKYDKLFPVINKIIHDSKLKLFNLQYENWKIREAYVHFLIEAGKIKLTEKDMEHYKSFKLAKFLNDVPMFSKDKRGKNISILVVQMLFFIVRGKYDEAIDRIDSLKQYTYRYLRNDDTFRSNCFIKMLINIPQANFHPVGINLRSKDLEKKLRNHEFIFHGINKEVEVIPFHDLWSIIIDVLDHKKSLGQA